MKKTGLFAAAVFLSLSSGVFAADVDFDKGIGDVLDIVNTLAPQHGGGIPQPGHPQPVGPGGGHQQPGNPGNHPGPGGDHQQPGNNHGNDNNHPGPGNNNWDNNHGNNNNHPGPGHNDWDNNHGNPGWDNNHGGPNDWDHQHPQPHYNGPTYECTDLTFKTDTPNPFTGKIYFYDYQGQIHDQKFSLNIGARDLKPWESEIITVCDGNITQDKTLFNYAVNKKDASGFGSFFTGTKSYEYTLTPTGRKASTPDGQGLVMEFGGATPNNGVGITLTDKWASFYQGQQVTFNLKIMRMPANIQNLTPQELINALKETVFSVSYPVSGQYQIQLFNEVLPGTYMVTVDYVRGGSSLSQIFSFTI